MSSAESESGRVHFYDSLRGRLIGWLSRKLGGRLSRLMEFAFLIPDITFLLGRLLLDSRAPRRLRIKLGMILAYVASPLDLIPEAVIGPAGLLEDVLLLAFALDRVFAEVDEAVLEEHWSGRPGDLNTLRELACLVDGIFSGRVGGKLHDWYAEDSGPGAGEADSRMELVSGEDETEDRIERLRASGL